MCICQSSYGVLPTRGSGSDEDLVFDEFPTGKLRGKRAKVFDEKEIVYDFDILKVTGHVTWKHKMSTGKDAKLFLLRSSDGGGSHLPKLELAKYASETDEEGFTTTTFKFDRNDAKATNSYLFWNPGYNGVFWCKRVRMICIASLQVIDTHTMTQAKFFNWHMLSGTKQASSNLKTWLFA